MILTLPAHTKLTFMDYLLTMLRYLLRRKQGHDKLSVHCTGSLVIGGSLSSESKKNKTSRFSEIEMTLS